MRAINLRTTLLGLVSWLVPFVVAFFFVDRTGQFLIPQPLFKSIMVVLSGACGIFLLMLAFRRIRPTTQSGFALGFFWLALNLGLDLAILLPLGKMTIMNYFYDIGVRYLLIPIFSTALGAMAERGK